MAKVFALAILAFAVATSAWLLNPDPRVGCPAGHYHPQDSNRLSNIRNTEAQCGATCGIIQRDGTIGEWGEEAHRLTPELHSDPQPQMGGSRNNQQFTYHTHPTTGGTFAWGEKCKAWSVCNDGFNQSPINIPSSAPTTGNLHVMYGMAEVQFTRVDRVVTWDINQGPHMLWWNNMTFNLEKIEFHYPSEHSIDGRHHDFEMQLYHSRTDPVHGKHYAAIALLFDVDQCNNDFLDKVFPLIPHVTECQCGNDRTENYNHLPNILYREQCDRGRETTENNPGRDNECRQDCTLPICGDRILDTTCGEKCDNGLDENNNSPNHCRANCTLPVCGDSIIDNDDQFGEQCDQGWSWYEVAQTWSDANRPPGLTNTPNGDSSGFTVFDVTHCDARCRWSCGNGRRDVFPDFNDHYLDPYLNGTGWQEECDNGDANTDEPNCGGAESCCRRGHPNPAVSGLWPMGDSMLGGCVRAQCGDGILDDVLLSEQCDVGPGNAPNAVDLGANNCHPGCVRPTCGDGNFDPSWPAAFADGTIESYNEECDPTAPAPPGAAPGYCDDRCRLRCGNGELDNTASNGIDNQEECDNGALNNNTIPNACRENCLNPTCGDGVTDDGEQCDDPTNPCACWPANDPNGNACTFRCGNAGINGQEVINGVTCPAEECDNGHESLFPLDGNSDTRPNACRQNCMFWTCGDMVVDPLDHTLVGADDRANGEQCDNGVDNNDEVPDACRTSCKLACCGDGVTDSGEECDNGPVNDNNENILNAGCGQNCVPLCGDGVRGDGEDCDDGMHNSDETKNHCRTNCVQHHCGDGVTDDDEECDNGDANSSDAPCNTQCKLTFCGDGVIQQSLGEECDEGDANTWADPLGCSPLCTVNRCGATISSPRPDNVVNLNLKDLIPQVTGGAYSYHGSHTHPPCTENVQWLVLKNRQRIGIDQIWYFENFVGNNSRPVQHTGGRVITEPSRFGAPMPMSHCGNGMVEPGEECDDGRRNSDIIPNACRKNCKAPHCGDGVVDQGEECESEEYCANCMIIRHRYSRFDEHNNTCNWWNYENEDIWHHLGMGCMDCMGHRQSPIRLPEACPITNRPISLNHPANMHYTDTPVVLFNTGQNILWPIFNGGTFSFHGKTYTLEHIEFHEPSEHWIGNKRFDFEIQLHHKIAQNPNVHQRAILSVLFENSGHEHNDFLDKFWNYLPVTHECRCGNGIKEDLYCWPDGRITKEECDNGDMNADHVADACRTNCQLPRCGDGVVDMGEACDWGVANSMEPNHCRPDCTVPMCGDGVTDDLFAEKCDDGNCEDRDGCDSKCHPECGNGVVDNEMEECDDGARNSDSSANACRTNCMMPRCGDGIVDEEEECDMGEHNAPEELTQEHANLCRFNCTWPVCGDGVTDSMNLEQCDDGFEGSASCTKFDEHHNGCKMLCGNGIVDEGEQCDDGAANSDKIPNACRTNCMLPRCGDGVRDSHEECDGPAPWCNDRCRVCCGNGILECDCVEEDEECDHGILNSDSRPAACRTDCKLPRCGDGVIDAWIPGSDCFEECDSGAGNSDSAPNACRSNCKKHYCGDGVLDAGEECDDGNNLCGDGCTGGCKLECGNGRLDPGEACDDGEGNGVGPMPGCCRQDCTLPFCGDGITDWDEECDDGEMNKDGPNTCRTNCKLPVCGDGIVDHYYGEKCDYAHMNSETAVDGCSPRCTPNLCAQSVNMDILVNPHDMIPKAPGAYCYDGSINHPPCTEDAQWFVFSAAQPISDCQLRHFRRILHNNARPTQALNGRTVSWLEDKAVCGDGVVEGNEECDDGSMNSDWMANACRRNCRRAHCGDGVQDAGEQCDGTPNCGPNCRLSCPSALSCPNCDQAKK